ncbi:MAG: LPP20 family lipoprotein [Treponema sp.]|jgi:hypothetical protein|nr:LPP20 family lipoprotein [Treponema sp.]
MKKSVYMLLTAVVAVSLMLTGCGSAPSAKTEATKKINLPSFVLNPPSTEDAIYGVGSSNNSNPQRALEMAKARARTDLSLKLNAQVKAMITDYTRSAGTDESTVNLNFYESISQQLTNSTLAGVEDVKTESTDDGVVWTLVRLSKADAAKAAADKVKEVYESEASQYAEFKALNAIEAMNAQLEKASAKDLQPTGVEGGGN